MIPEGLDSLANCERESQQYALIAHNSISNCNDFLSKGGRLVELDRKCVELEQSLPYHDFILPKHTSKGKGSVRPARLNTERAYFPLWMDGGGIHDEEEPLHPSEWIHQSMFGGLNFSDLPSLELTNTACLDEIVHASTATFELFGSDGEHVMDSNQEPNRSSKLSGARRKLFRVSAPDS